MVRASANSTLAETDPLRAIRLDELIERLRGEPGGGFSVAMGTPCLVVDLEGAGPVSESEIRILESGLAELPVPAFCRLPEEAGEIHESLAARFDCLAENDADHRRLVERCEQHPLASLALVQLLRQGSRLSIHEGLIAESFVYSMLQAGPDFESWLEERGGPARPAPQPATSPVLAERGEGRLRITLNCPEKHNAFSAAMRDGLCDALTVVRSDPDIREVVIDGAGESFCSGGDLDEFGSFPDPATAHAVRSTRSAGRLLASVAGRVRAEVHGACVGAGVELPAFASRVVAHPGAFFELPEVSMGLVPGAGGTVSIARRIGRQRTAWMALTGARVDAQTALSWNLVDEVREFAPTRESS